MDKHKETTMLTARKVKANSGARLFVAGYVAMSLAANAQFFSPVPEPDASDIWMRNQIMNLQRLLRD